ncbi:MAG: tRNA ((37)-N(1))-methyltransferase, partial [Evtepia sp.]|nr:tRNA ((37)-N(1))-methyltransferase [Evtepia sp.]
EIWHDRSVPAILLSGHHANIAKWRRKQSIIRTRDRRPDLYARLDLSSKADQKLLKEIAEEETKS